MPTELKVNPVYKNHVPPLSPDVYENLEASIKANGCMVPIVVWDGTIVDGHNRYEICQKYGIPFEVKEEHFGSEEEVLLWITAQQLTRRNLTPVERVVQALKEKPTLIAMGKKKQGFRSDLHHLADDGHHNTRHILAKMAGVSPWLVGTIEQIFAHDDESLKKQVLTGEISPSYAIDIIKSEEHRKEDERLEKEEAARQAAKANKSKNNADDRWGVIIPFPKQRYQPNWCRDDYVDEPDPYYESQQARSRDNGYHGLLAQYDDDDQYDDDERYDDDQDIDDQDEDYQQSRSLFVPRNSIGYHGPVNLDDIKVARPYINEFEYIKDQYRDHCDSLLERSNALLSDYILDEDRTKEKIDEIKEIVIECFNSILTSLDNACKTTNQASTF